MQIGNGGAYAGRRFRDIPYTGRKSRNVEEGNGRACRKEMEEPAGRKFRDIQEGNRGTCRKKNRVTGGRNRRNKLEGHAGRKGRES